MLCNTGRRGAQVAWRTGVVAWLLAALVVMVPQAVLASTGCRLLDGQAGQLGPGQMVALNPSQAINFNAGDVITLTSSSPNSRGDVITLDVAVSSITQLLDSMPTTQSMVMPRSIVGGPSTLFINTTQVTPGLVANYAIRCQSIGPTVTRITPSIGRAGTSVSIEGSGFLGTTGVSFGGRPAAGFTLRGDEQISAIVPAGAGSVAATVTTDAGTASGGSFTYVTAPATPSIQSVTAGDAQVAVAFATADDGGLPITQYVVTTYPGGATTTGSSSPLTITGLSNGTPYTFTVAATNAAGTSAPSPASQAVVPLALPTALDRSLTTDYGRPVSIDLGSVINGAGITGIVIASAPDHGTATVSATTVTYTPADGFQGATDAFSYVTVNAVGRSSPGRVSIMVGRPAVPAPSTLEVVTSAGVPVTILPPPGAPGPQAWDRLAVEAPATHGQVRASGRTLVYTPQPGFVGTDTFTYRSATAFGTSEPAVVSVNVVATGTTGTLSHTLLAMPGATVSFDLSTLRPDAVSAGLIGLSPAEAAEVSLSPAGLLAFTAAPSFHGLVQVSAMLSTATGEAVPVSVLVLVSPQPDPSKDTEVLGLITAQAEQARRFAQGQMDNIQARLADLRERARDVPALSNQLALTVNGRQLPMGLLQGVAAGAAEGGQKASAPLGALRSWFGGQARFGRLDARAGRAGLDSTTVTVSAGADARVGERGSAGLALGYSHDDSDIGIDGARSRAEGYSVALYGSLQPGEHAYVDLIAGGGGLRFTSQRGEADDGLQVSGRRHGRQWFGSITAGLDYRWQGGSWSPYARASWSRSSLDGFIEQGPATRALRYGEQTVRSLVAALGVRVRGEHALPRGMLSPYARIEVGHDFQGNGHLQMAYAEIPSAGEWRVLATPAGTNGTHGQLGVGLDLRLPGQWSLGGEYGYFMQAHGRDQAIRLTLNKDL